LYTFGSRSSTPRQSRQLVLRASWPFAQRPQRATIRPLAGHHKNAESVVPGHEANREDISKQGGYRNVATEWNACRFAAGAVSASPRGRRRKREIVDELWRRHSEHAF